VSLADLLVARVAPRARAELDQVADLGRVVDELVTAARAAWPAFAVDDETFLGHVAACLPEEDAARALVALHAEDLLLACACAAGEPRAVAALEGPLAEIEPAITRQGGHQLIAEVKQLLRERLLVAEAGQRPKIADYSGRGPLVAWLRVAAIRTTLDLHRGARKLPPAGSRELDELKTAHDPELDLIKHRYRDEFGAAFQRSLEQLTRQERNVLRLHFLDGLSIDEIGLIYKVHRSTVARWIARCRESLFGETRRRMREKLRLKSGEFESLMGVVQSQLDVSIHRFLSQSDG
jgi:RNA polymerase sigma-70 factor (ECF subfamily)